MSVQFGPTLSALDAFSTSQQVTANNIANVSTNEFRSSRVDLETGPNGQGVRVADITENTEPGPLVPELRTYENSSGQMEQERVYVEGSNTDLARETVQMITDSTAFKANVAVLRTMEQTTGALLDMLI